MQNLRLLSTKFGLIDKTLDNLLLLRDAVPLLLLYLHLGGFTPESTIFILLAINYSKCLR